LTAVWCKPRQATIRFKRSPSSSATRIATARKMKADGHTARDIAKYLGVSRATLYRYLAEDSAA